MGFGVQAVIAHHVGMHLARTGHFQPTAGQRPAPEGDVDLGAGLGEGEERRAETHVEIVGLEELPDKIAENELQVLEADVLADPQSFALVEHRRVRGVTVDAVGTARRNDADFGDGQAVRDLAGMARSVGLGIPHLHRAGVRTQVQPAALGVF